jgi:prepilin-type N-terminal cleavage/methylation domain-containing protein
MNGQSGFTVMELLISLAIFGVVTGFLMASFRTGRMIDEIRIGSQVAASAVRQVQTRALSGSTVGICASGSNKGKLCGLGVAGACPSGTCAPQVPRGYGVRFSATGERSGKAVIFADLNGNRSFDSDESLLETSYSPSGNVSAGSFYPMGTALDVVFEPPRPTVYVNSGTAENSVTVTLRHETTGQTRSIRINRVTGQVSGE